MQKPRTGTIGARPPRHLRRQSRRLRLLRVIVLMAGKLCRAVPWTLARHSCRSLDNAEARAKATWRRVGRELRHHGPRRSSVALNCRTA
ncbi:unnamed protein product [Closterium sp. NIES-64]|nr:unnamed protein product [Closterium sp. NIES-64]CAI5995143.1 unnamed protein product [Closterium sp. NIES-65]